MSWPRLLQLLRRSGTDHALLVAGMGRRQFLKTLSAGALGVTAAALVGEDLERLVWVPGERTIFLPPPRENQFITLDWIATDVLDYLRHLLAFADSINRQYDERYPFTSGLRIAHNVTVSLPKRFAR